MHIILPFLVLVTGILVTSFILLFSTHVSGRLSGVALILSAGVIVGAMVTANFNGGKPYGYEVGMGLPYWKSAPVPSVSMDQPIIPVRGDVLPVEPPEDKTPVA